MELLRSDALNASLKNLLTTELSALTKVIDRKLTTIKLEIDDLKCRNENSEDHLLEGVIDALRKVQVTTELNWQSDVVQRKLGTIQNMIHELCNVKVFGSERVYDEIQSNNIVIHGLSVPSNATKLELVNIVKLLFKIELEIRPAILSASFIGNNAKSILVNLREKKDKFIVFKNCFKLKYSSQKISIVEELSVTDQRIRRQKLADLKIARNNGKRAFLRKSELHVFDKLLKNDLFENGESSSTEIMENGENILGNIVRTRECSVFEMLENRDCSLSGKKVSEIDENSCVVTQEKIEASGHEKNVGQGQRTDEIVLSGADMDYICSIRNANKRDGSGGWKTVEEDIKRLVKLYENMNAQENDETRRMRWWKFKEKFTRLHAYVKRQKELEFG